MSSKDQYDPYPVNPSPGPLEALNEGAETREEFEQRMNRVLRAAQAVWRDRLTHNASVIASGIDYFESGLDAPKGTID